MDRRRRDPDASVRTGAFGERAGAVANFCPPPGRVWPSSEAVRRRVVVSIPVRRDLGVAVAKVCVVTAHPLQPALDRSARALRTVTDLLEIAKGRKRPNGRSDARQASLYRAVVAASVGVVEEAAEALIAEALRSQGVASTGMTVLAATVARLMQNPNSSEIRKLMTAFVGFDPTSSLAIRLRTSRPAFRSAEVVGVQTSRQLWTIYNQERTWTGDDAGQVLDRFVKIRHSFAHQDSSVVLFTKPEVDAIRARLSTRLAEGPDEVHLVEKLNATCAVRVLTPAAAPQDPVRDWRLHETHAINALLMSAGIVASIAGGLAAFLDSTAGVSRATYDALHLEVERGEWVDLAGPTLVVSPCGVSWNLVPYRPGSRT